MPGGVTGSTLRGMTNLPPPAEELRLLDAELWRLDAHRAVLLQRRAWLIHTLQSAAASRGGQDGGAGPPVWPGQG